MKEFKGTKGEWTVKTDFREPTILNESNQVIFTHNKACYDTVDDFHAYYSHNKMMANTNLIAAAPDLLEALKELVESLENIQESDLHNNTVQYYLKEDIEQAKEAINKALALQ